MAMARKGILKKKSRPVDRVKNELKKDMGKLFLMLIQENKKRAKPTELKELKDKIIDVNKSAEDTNSTLNKKIHEGNRA